MSNASTFTLVKFGSVDGTWRAYPGRVKIHYYSLKSLIVYLSLRSRQFGSQKEILMELFNCLALASKLQKLIIERTIGFLHMH